MTVSTKLTDNEFRELALDTKKSFIVQAPAGSGKTELLAQRYIKLLSQSAQPENVLAMTFSKKATAELKERIIQHLKNAKLAKPKEQYQIKTFEIAKKALLQSDKQNWDLINNPERINVMTIDALANFITTKYPDINEIINAQIISEQYENEKFYLEAAKNTFRLIDEKEYAKDLTKVLLYLDNNVEKFYRLLINMLGKRDQWLPKLYNKDVAEISILQKTAHNIIENHLKLLQSLAKKHFNKEFFKVISKNQQGLKELPKANIDAIDDWLKLQQLCLTNKGDWRKVVNKNQGFTAELKNEKNAFIEILLQLNEADNLKNALEDLTTLPSIEISKEESEIIKSIVNVMKLATAQLNIIFADNNAVDFIQIFINALNKLKDNDKINDITLFLDYQIEHLLVDEFQDTSHTQFYLIEQIINNWQEDDNKTLFFVGDPMQSIYRFRESDVGIFLAIQKNGIANIKPIYLQLQKNFRSIKTIVDNNNKYFANIFPENQSAQTGAISYAKSIAHSNIQDDNAVNFYGFRKNMQIEQARKVCEVITQSLDKNLEDEIAVLVHSRAHLKDISKILQQKSISYEAVKTVPLKENLFTKDLLILTRVLLSMTDKLAWLAILRSPWCAVLLKELLIFSDCDKTIIYEQLLDKNKIKELSPKSLLRVKNLTNILGEAINNKGRFSFVEIFSWTLNKLSPEKYLDEQKSAIKSQFLNILSACENKNDIEITTIEGMLDGLYSPSVKSRLKLMTIHQAKGLEFDVVILAGLGKGSKKDSSPLIALKEMANKNLLIAPIKSANAKKDFKSYIYLTKINKKQDRFEMMRLLYVAMSRAKKSLHIFGFVNEKDEAMKGTSLSFIYPFFQNSAVISTKTDNDEKTLKDEKNNLLSYEVERLETEQKDNTIVVKKSEIPNIKQIMLQKSLGTILHKFLEYENFKPNESVIYAQLTDYGIAKKLHKSYADKIKSALKKISEDEDAKWIFKKRTSTKKEAEFANTQKTIIVDRMFIENKVLWIIDFKTTSIKNNETIAQFTARIKKNYQKQLDEYEEILGQIFKLRIRKALYCTDLPKLVLL